MATIRKRVGKRGKVTYRIDYYDPDGKRKRKDFDLKKDAEAYLGKVNASKKEGRYFDVFDIKTESHTTFNELAEKYVENFRGQKSFKTSKRFMVPRYVSISGISCYPKSLTWTWKPTTTGARGHRPTRKPAPMQQ